MKLFVKSFGCQMSFADAEEMSLPLLAKGFTLTHTIQEADVLLLNTCSVRQHAEHRAISFIGRLKPWKEARPKRFLIVAGCAAERLGGAEIRRKFPHVDLVVGAKSIEQYPSLLAAALRASPLASPPTRHPSTVPAFVTLMRGCDYSCSYCIVPSVRGREIHRAKETVLAEVRAKVEAGAREITLLGQTVNSYRTPEGGDFSDLLNEVEAVAGLERIRFMSPHPNHLNDKLIRTIAESKKLCSHLHLPLQSGSDTVLKRMNRGYSVGEFREKVEHLRAAVPAISLTTDFIVGFPGETEEDFKRTLETARQLDPDSAYCFKYSPRPGTKAAEFPDDVPLAAKEERLKRLLDEVSSRTRRHMAAWKGRRIRVILQDERSGRTERYFTAILDEPGRLGELVEAEVTGATNNCLLARRLPGADES